MKKYALIFLTTCLILTGCGKKEEKPVMTTTTTTTTYVEPEKRASMIMFGDCLLHGAVYQDADNHDGTYNFDKMFEYIKPVVQKYDLKFYNQESIIGGKSLGLSTYPRFNSPEEIGDTMTNMGFNLVSLANNHTLDRGKQGVLNSVAYWKTKDAMVAGSYASEEERQNVQIGKVNGITYTLLSYTTATNGLYPPYGEEYLTSIYDEQKVLEDINRVKDKVDVIIVSMHWGVEYTHTPNYEQKQIANYLSSLGVDIVIGHHPHVVQPIEYIGDTLVIYSLGNMISAQIGTERLTGGVVSLDIVKDDEGVRLENIKTDLIYTSYSNYITNFKVIPYSQLSDNILYNYLGLKEAYMNVLTEYDKTISVGIFD